MTKKKVPTKTAGAKKDTPQKVDIKIQGQTSMDPVVGKFPDEIPDDTEEFKITKNIEAILKKDISKSDKMRALFKIQVTSNKEIAHWTNSHPSFVATVVLKLKRQIKKEANK
tara:strand:- start:87 stop:422 length:336 start_codon:yes stop_codon:yes gene_type:complete